jgi:hypothetical protein
MKEYFTGKSWLCNHLFLWRSKIKLQGEFNMKNRFLTVILLLILLVTLTGNVQAMPQAAVDPYALVFVSLASPDDLSRFSSTQLPLYSMLDGGLLTGATLKDQQTLSRTGLSFQVLDPDLRAGSYYLAEIRPGRPALDLAVYGRVLLETTHGALLRLDSSQVDALAQAGAELTQITLVSKPLPAAQEELVLPDVVEPDPMIQGMIDQVTLQQVSQYDRELAGELPVWVDGGWYTITSRYTYSNTPIEKTMHYVGQHMEALGLGVEYHQWGGPTYPNVIGEIPGLINPDDIFIIGAHIDDVQGTPGADDNASGSVATLIAADILSQYQWGCTLRFALWTGEEQGLNGSAAYAQRSFNQGENIAGYLNLDMIAWNTPDSAPAIDLYYSNSVPGTLAFAQLFADVVDAYNLNLIPGLGTGVTGSDHASFWQYGYNSILAIEDNGDFNPYYHGPGDTPTHTDLPYFTDFVKASVATFAHKSECLIPSGLGGLDGHVTASSGGAPIEGATVSAEDNQGRSYPATTDSNGYYTRTLMADTYTVTASAYGYMPVTITGVEVITDTTATQDFSLSTAPTHIVSGTVTETGTGTPLLAEIRFDGTPVVVWTDESSGYYEAELPEDSYNMRVKAAFHLSQQRDIVLDQDQTQNFTLDPLPCILLVDDDQDAPDVRNYYTGALDNLGFDYSIWDVSTQGDPEEADLSGYQQVMWFIGYPYSGTFTGDNEAAVGSYLNSGGNFFLSSQDYLYDNGLTPFVQNYLHVASFTSDVTQTTVSGQNVFSGLGPYSLAYPFTNYSDRVNPDNQAQLAFSGNQGNAAVSFDGLYFNTVFLGFPFESISSLAGRSAVMERTVDFLGGCEPPDDPIEGLTAENDSPTLLGDTTTFTATITGGTNVTYDWDFGDGHSTTGQIVEHIYEAAGTYSVTVTATNSRGSASAETLAVIETHLYDIFLPQVVKN